MKFQYEISSVDSEGSATITYSNPILGRIIKKVFLPIDRPNEVIERAIKNAFPREMFNARKIRENKPSVESMPKKGSFDTDLSDPFADFVVEEDVGETIRPGCGCGGSCLCDRED